MVKQSALAIVALVILLRLPFLHQPIQGDDVDYLYGAEHAQIDPLHPLNTRYMFSGEMVDMRGHSHGPVNPWILGILLAALGDVREVPFHLAYTLFSIIAALAMWSLARRFCERPFAATLLFIAVPAFVVNGNSFEADLPFLAFWMASIALFVNAVDEQSTAALACSALAGAIAGLTAYQAVLLTPILAVYLFQRRRTWYPAWAVMLAAPAAIAVWQLWEWRTRGALPAAVLLGYMRSYSFNKTSNMLRSGVALVVHSGWIVSPLLVIAAFLAEKDRWRWIAAAVATLAAAFYDPNPLFWLSVGCGVLVLTWLSHRSPAPRFPGRLGRHLLRRGAADLLRWVCPLPAADCGAGRDSRRAHLPRLDGSRRIRFANDIVAWPWRPPTISIGTAIANSQRHWLPTPPNIASGSMPNGACAITWNRRARCLSRGIKWCSPAIPSYPARWLTPSP